ncbi:MAG: hypothetical protein QNK40_04100, partial [Desulfobacterales bacterium]|nr:hypothetical protein [Desulfobacterales bacterium]
RCIRVPEMGNLERLHAADKTQRFSSNSHEGPVIGVIEKGQLGDQAGNTECFTRAAVSLGSSWRSDF